MSDTSCEITNKNILALENNDRISDDAYKALTKFVNVNETLEMELTKEFDRGEVVDEKILNSKIANIIKGLYGKKSERKLLAAKLHALMQGTALSEDMMYDFIVTHLPKGLKVGKKTGEVDSITGEAIRNGIDLELFPLSSLKLFLGQALKVITAVNPNGAAYANFGGIMSAVKTPVSLKWKDPTGAFPMVSSNVRDYSRFVSSRINMFMDNPKQLAQWVKDYNKGKNKEDRIAVPEMAMNDILENLSNFSGVRRGETTAKHVQRLFHTYMTGWSYIDPSNGKVMIYEDWNIVIEDGKAKRYDTGDIVYNFSNPVPLSNYKNGEWNVVLNATEMKKFLYLTEQARAVDDAVFEYMNIEFQESIDDLMGSLAETFTNLTEEQLSTIFFNSETRKAKEILKALNPEQVKQYKELKNTFGMYINDSIVIANGSKVEKKSRHWPIMYDINVYKMMLDSLKAELSEKISFVTKKIEEAEKNSQSKARWLTELDTYSAKLAYAESIIDNIDGYHRDHQSQSLIPFASDNKYFKRISNAYDIRSGRQDTGVYYDYLKHVMSAIERNKMSATLVDGLRIVESDAVKRTIVNLFKVPFGDPTVEGAFGLTVEGQANIINSITPNFLFNKTGKELQQSTRDFAGYLTAAYLSGTGSPITNMTAQFENIYDFSFKTFQLAFHDYYSEQKIPGRNITKGEAIRGMIQRSGITEFSDFFSKAMVNGIVGIQLEQDVADQILGEMLLFWDKTGKGPWKGIKRLLKGKKRTKELVAYEEFQDNVGKLLDQSSLFVTNLDAIVILDEGRIGNRAEALKKEKRTTAINKLIQYAINKEYEFKHALEFVPIGKFKEHVTGPIKNLTLTVGQMFGQIAKHQFNLTMSDTEAAIRSFSFVIGANEAWVHGAIRNDIHWWEYTDESDIQQVLRIGSEYNYFVNFGLSTQDVGRFNWNGFGNLWGKFKYWSQQKFGKDMRRWEFAYRSLKSNQKVQNQNFDGVAVAKLLGYLFDPRISSNKAAAKRAALPQVQAFRVWFWTQGLSTMMWDIFIRGPFRIPILTRWAYGKMGMGQIRNFGSDMLSWVFLLPTIFIRGMMLDDEPIEDGELQKYFIYYMRKLHLGYLPMMGFDMMLSMISWLHGNMKTALDKFPIPLPPPIERELKQLLQEVTDAEDLF
tara:strand:+ start:7118 stop:10582 length:3465 start_codon:yes stop_codon:yes gene_type:complete